MPPRTLAARASRAHPVMHATCIRAMLLRNRHAKTAALDGRAAYWDRPGTPCASRHVAPGAGIGAVCSDGHGRIGKLSISHRVHPLPTNAPLRTRLTRACDAHGPPSAFLAPATGPGAASQALELGARLIAGGSGILAADEEKECCGTWYLADWGPKDAAGLPGAPV